MHFDLDAVYHERDRRLNMPDEDLDDYVNRLRKSQELHDLPQSYAHHRMSTQSQPHNRSVTRPKSVDDSRTNECATDTEPFVSNIQLEPESVIEGHSSLSNNLHIDGSSSVHGVMTSNLQEANEMASTLEHSSLSRPNHHILSAVHVVSTSSIQSQIGTHSHIEEVANVAQVLPGPSENQDPLTSPIEDVSESLPESPKKRTGRARKQAHVHLNVEQKVHAAYRLSKRGHQIEDIPVTLETLRRNKTSSDDSSIIDDASSRSSSPPMRAQAPSNTLGVVQASNELKRKRSRTEVIKKRVKEKKDKVLPEDHARSLMNKAQSELQGTARKKYVQFLAGKNIFYTGGDMRYATERTKNRMEIIVRYGGTLIPKFDAAIVTHIVTDTQMRTTLLALGLKSLDDIPGHIPTVKWSWIVSGIGRTPSVPDGINIDVKLDEVWLHAAFSKRIDAGIPRVTSSLSKAKMNNRSIDISNISQFSQEGNSGRGDDVNDVVEDIGKAPALPLIPIQHPVVSHYQATSSKVTLDVPNGATAVHDPLEEFYAKAKVASEGEWSRHAETGGSGLESDYSDLEPGDIPQALPKRGWTCDKQGGQRKPSPNQDVIDKLQELMELHKSKPGDEDKWRAYSYSKCIRTLKNYPRRIRTISEARSIRGIGEKTAIKIMEIIETGQLRRIEYENTDDVKVSQLFQGVYGVGQSTAFKWYAAGCRTLEDLVAGKGGVKLNQVQEIGIKYYSDINSRMPRDEAKAIFDLIKPTALQLDPRLFVEIMGSFRRGKADCGDIDVLITRPTDDGKTHAGILPNLLRDLHAGQLLTEDLALPEDPNDLEAIYRGLCRLPKEGSKHRRIDFLTVPWHSRGAALLYYTGDDIFNRAMRMKAKVMGYSLNQRGLSAGVVRDPHDWRVKTNPGKLIASETEEEIFKILEVPWQEPHERVRG